MSEQERIDNLDDDELMAIAERVSTIREEIEQPLRVEIDRLSELLERAKADLRAALALNDRLADPG